MGNCDTEQIELFLTLLYDFQSNGDKYITDVGPGILRKSIISNSPIDTFLSNPNPKYCFTVTQQ